VQKERLNQNMAIRREQLNQRSERENGLSLAVDVLVIGGGPAGTWAAWSAAAQGARVALVDKGYCGASGAAAPSGNTLWYSPPDPEQREMAVISREARNEGLSDRTWMSRVLNQTYTGLHALEDWGYPFPLDDQGQVYRRSLQGPEYMRLMRKQVKRAGVQILDHSPALELLISADGLVAGAAGIRRQVGDRASRDGINRWWIKAGAVVIASGGCAFLSKALGCNVLTGDGYLMAVEAGAELSGMEFSNVYGIVPTFASVTKNAFYRWATFTHEDGTPIEGANAGKGRPLIARALSTQPVYAQINRADETTQAMMRLAQPNFFLPFDRAGINPFTQRFPITLRLEGTVRGTGGIRIVDSTCATSVPGLFAAGDAATRELVCGGASGGGSLNAAWAISSGTWAGEAAAQFATVLGNTDDRPAFRLGGATLRSTPASTTQTLQEFIQAVQAEVFPYDRNLFRSESVLQGSLARLNTLWQEISSFTASDSQALQARETAAMIATARWMYATALARKESRGMHKREDYPHTDPQQTHRLVAHGLDHIWVTPEPQLATEDLFIREVATL
jgi:succinate dehydrogenase/fumarate reductase flavoprotein subunit